MRHSAFLVLALAIAPLSLAACGTAPVDPSTGGSGGTSNTAGSPGTGGGGAPGTGGEGAGGAPGTGGSGGTGGVDTSPYLVDLDLPAATPSPVNLGDVEATFHEDVAYGTDPLHRFDIYLPKSDTPTPLMIHIHGGGFVGGDKAQDNNQKLVQALAQGVAYASLNYRLLQDMDEDGVLKPLSDCKRALQFLRYNAEKLNIDPTRVVVKGGSAGAGTSLWIGLHDEMAADGGDPVAKMSTRVLGIAANATQATYDVVKWETVVFADYDISLLDAVAALGMEQLLASFYGMGSIDQLESPEIQAYRAEVDMLAHMTADDPPIYVHNPMMTLNAPMTQGELYHHAYHARAVMEQAQASGIPVVAVIEALGIDDSPGQDEYDFLLDKLK